MVIPSLVSLIPEDYILMKVDKVLKTGWVRSMVAHLYSKEMGRPSIDPESALRLMLAGYLLGITRNRALMREAHVNFAIRWFCGFSLEDSLPDHSSLSKTRKRWGHELFCKIFRRTVKMCVEAGLVDGETVHVDATLVRADVSWESMVDVYIDRVIEENDGEDGDDVEPPAPKKRKHYRAPEKERRSTTDPDATLSRSSRRDRFQPNYKQHTAVDDRAGVIVDVEVTTGKVSESGMLVEQVKRVEDNTGVKVRKVTADAGYASSENYRKLEEMDVDPVIPAKPERKQGKSIPARRFHYDEKHHVMKCPGGKMMRCAGKNDEGWIFAALPEHCKQCRLQDDCVPESRNYRRVFIPFGHTALLRARRRKRIWKETASADYARHMGLVEGRHAEAKQQHGLRRAMYRGIENMKIQAFLTATAINLKRLAAFIHALLQLYLSRYRRFRSAGGFFSPIFYGIDKNRPSLLSPP